MKTLFTILILISSALAQAATNDVCGPVIPCGTFHTDEKLPDGHTVSRELMLIPVGRDQVTIGFKTVDGTKTTSQELATLTYAKSGLITNEKNGVVAVAGVCRGNSCGLAIEPSSYNGQVYIEHAIFRFVGDTVELHKFVVDAQGDDSSTKAVFTR